MFTSIDKALVALISAVLYLLAEFFNITFAWVTPELVQDGVTFLTPLLVFLVPNKKTVP